jgi:hypothetical protein
MAAPTPPRCPIGGSDHAPRTTIAPPRERFPCTAPPVPMARPFPHHSASVVLRTVVSSSTVCMEIPDRFHSPLVTGCSATRRCGSFVARLLLRSIQPAGSGRGAYHHLRPLCKSHIRFAAPKGVRAVAESQLPFIPPFWVCRAIIPLLPTSATNGVAASPRLQ